jgi:hypothetical protein
MGTTPRSSRIRAAVDAEQDQPHQHEAEDDPQNAAHSAQERAFDNDQRDEPPARHSQHAEERKLRAAAHDRKRLGREHEQAAREQRDQGQHLQVDAVGTGQAGACGRVGRGSRRDDTRRQPAM